MLRQAFLQICDRPKVLQQIQGREYIQPQWVVDSANFRVLVDARLYAPGVIPPPHLSPFVDAEEEGYVPDYLATLRKMQASFPCGTALSHKLLAW